MHKKSIIYFLNTIFYSLFNLLISNFSDNLFSIKGSIIVLRFSNFKKGLISKSFFILSTRLGCLFVPKSTNFSASKSACILAAFSLTFLWIVPSFSCCKNPPFASILLKSSNTFSANPYRNSSHVLELVIDFLKYDLQIHLRYDTTHRKVNCILC